MQDNVFENNFIGAWLLDDLTICDNLINLYESNLNRTIEGTVGSEVRLNKKLKDCRELYIARNDLSINNYHTSLQKVCEKYIERYAYCSNQNVARWSAIENFKIQKYEPGQGYHAWHCEKDSIDHCLRHLVFMTYLNDVSDGGETAFLYQNVKVKPEKGLTLIWPAEWTHTHKGMVSMTQTKYIITGWYSFY